MSKVSVEHCVVPSCNASPRPRRILKLTTRLIALGLVAGSFTALQAQYYKVIYNFGSGSDPSCPNSAPLTQTPGGKLVGTVSSACQGGQNGAAFEIGYQGTGFTILQSFGTTLPTGGLTLGTDQRFHGTTNLGGSRNHGTEYRLSTAPSLNYEHDFLGGADGGYPGAPPIQSSTGDWYGTTGGSATAFAGTVYKITGLKYSVLHLFTTTDGRGPESPLLEASDGNLYGTTTSGGQYGLGTIFRISPTGVFTSLYSFDGPHGEFPVGPLIQASDGNIYGATVEGGSLNSGTAFKMTLAGTISLFYDFSATSSQGNEPGGGLLEATDGNFYGALSSGGFNGDGAIYQLTKAGVFTVVHPFYGFTGAVPQNTLMQHTSGILYGTTNSGGTYGRGGVLFELNMGLAPFVTYLPVYGQVGATVDILGEYFTSGSTVYFNGVPAVNPRIASTFIEATVPAGATTGNITVTTSKGTLTSNKPFVVH